MNQGDYGGVVTGIDKPYWPQLGDINDAYMGGLLNLVYGRIHDPFALHLADSRDPENPLYCTGREYCNDWNSQYALTRFETTVNENAGEDIMPAWDYTRYTSLKFSPAKGGDVDPMWYQWTTPSPERLLQDHGPDTTTAAPPLPGFNEAPDCKCEESVEYMEVVKTIIISAGHGGLIAGVITALAGGLGANGGGFSLNNLEETVILSSESDELSMEQIIAE